MWNSLSYQKELLRWLKNSLIVAETFYPEIPFYFIDKKYQSHREQVQKLQQCFTKLNVL